MPRMKAFGKRRSFFYGQNNENNAEQLVNESNEKVYTSKFKIESASEMLDDIPVDDQSSVNIVIDLNIISELLKSMARCKYCNKWDSVIITKDARSRRVSLTLQCTFCGQAFTSMSSNSTNGVYDINVRLAYGLRCIGKGSSAAKTFCAVMNLPPPPAKFQRYNGILLESLSC
ncbi:uncharacterized protein TNCV_89701 [Trichonephila clavipes]|nr:uncharacterized protein TNCV_89701 [Trichonephila clavipes]